MTMNGHRRDFLKSAAAATTVAALGGTGLELHASDRENKKGSQMQIEVNQEWGALKEVVCGIPFLVVPETLPKSVYNYAPTEGIKFMEANLAGVAPCASLATPDSFGWHRGAGKTTVRGLV